MASTMSLLLGLRAAKVNANIIGDFGSGKSSMVQQMEKVLGVKVVLKSLNKMDTTDFSGITYLSEEMGTEYDREGNVVMGSDGKPKLIKMVKSSPSPFVRTLLENRDGILFMDEINRAPAALQSAALTIIQDGDAGDTKIAKSVWRVSAMNAADVGVNQFSLAAANRFCHIHHEANVEDFAKGFITRFKEIERPKINSEEKVLKERLKYRTLIVRFIETQPKLLSKIPDEGMEDELAFPTPRTWEMVSEVMAYLSENSKDYLFPLVTGCVGKEAGKLFLRFCEENNDKLVDLTEWLGKEDKFDLPNPDRPDEVYQILQNLEYWFEKDPVKWYAMWKRIVKLLHNDKHKYGKYTNYDNFLMLYWQDNFMSVIEHCLTGSEAQRTKQSRELRDELDGVYEIMTVNAI